MSEPNRYHLWAALECHAFSKAEAVLRFSAEEDGMWVQWQDYARLKAEVETLKEAWVDKKMQEDRDALLLEVERLRASSFVTAVPVEQYERVIKAGDAMACALILFEMKSEEERQGKIKAWSAAKEGKHP